MPFATLMILFSTMALGQGPGVSEVEVHGNQYFARIETSPSSYEAIIALSFEDPTTSGGITVDSLNISATEVDPTDPALRARLPAGFFVPARFPVVIQVDQGTVPGEEIEFKGSYNLELLTSHIDFRANSPWRLLKAPNGGAFEDISLSIGLGSFRVLGKSGSFSEFVIAADLRPQFSSIGVKVQSIQDLLDANDGVDIVHATYLVLDAQLNLVRTAFLAENYVLAMQRAEIMFETVADEAEVGNIDNTYVDESDGSLAGVLLGKIDSMAFSFELARLEDNDRTEVIEEFITVPGGYSFALRVLFTGVQALELDSLDIWAEEVDPNDPPLLARAARWSGDSIRIPSTDSRGRRLQC